MFIKQQQLINTKSDDKQPVVANMEAKSE